MKTTIHYLKVEPMPDPSVDASFKRFDTFGTELAAFDAFEGAVKVWAAANTNRKVTMTIRRHAGLRTAEVEVTYDAKDFAASVEKHAWIEAGTKEIEV